MFWFADIQLCVQYKEHLKELNWNFVQATADRGPKLTTSALMIF